MGEKRLGRAGGVLAILLSFSIGAQISLFLLIGSTITSGNSYLDVISSQDYPVVSGHIYISCALHNAWIA